MFNIYSLYSDHYNIQKMRPSDVTKYFNYINCSQKLKVLIW